MPNWWEPCQHDQHEAKPTHMSVLNASRLIVLLRKRPRNSGHRNRTVKSNVIKLRGVRACDRGVRKRFLQIVSQERGGGDKLETNITCTLLDR